MDVKSDLPLIEREILRFNPFKGNLEALKDKIVVEDWIKLYINNESYAVFHCLPLQIKELAIGHLLTEGIISKVEEIEKIEMSGKNVYAYLSREVNLKSKFEVISTICGEGSGRKLPPQMLKAIFKGSFQQVRFSVELVFKAAEFLSSQAHVFKASGGTHAASLLDKNGALIALAEDIGRHNAIDKVIGIASLKGTRFSETLLASTGRLTSEIVAKTAYSGIPLLVSLSAPTDRGIKIAEASGLTLIGFARGKRFNIYTFPERIF